MANTEVVFEPETFTVLNAPETVKINKYFAISFKVTAKDVSKTTIRCDNTGVVHDLSPNNTKAVANGKTPNYSYNKTFKAESEGTYTFTITVYGKNGGTAVKTVAVVVESS